MANPASLRWSVARLHDPSPQPVQKILFFRCQRLRTPGFDLRPNAFELPGFFRSQNAADRCRARLGSFVRRVGSAEVEKVHHRSGERAAEVGSVTDGQATATALSQQSPEIEADECEHPGEGRHGNDSEEENFVAWEMKRVGQQQPADRPRGT